jgi:hypothetical protein
MKTIEPKKENLLEEMDTALRRVLSNSFSNENFRKRLETIYNTKDIDSLSEEEKIKALLRYSQPFEREEELERKAKKISESMKSFEEMDFPEIDIPDIDFPELDFLEEELELDLPEIDFDFDFLGDEDIEEE